MYNEINEKYLPIGSVILLKDATKKLMITGFCSFSEDNPDIIYDYTGCLFPEGVMISNKTALFNHDQIEKIIYLGLVDEEEKEFNVGLISALKKIQNDNKE